MSIDIRDIIPFTDAIARYREARKPGALPIDRACELVAMFEKLGPTMGQHLAVDLGPGDGNAYELLRAFESTKIMKQRFAENCTFDAKGSGSEREAAVWRDVTADSARLIHKLYDALVIAVADMIVAAASQKQGAQ